MREECKRLPEICTNSTREELAACWDSPTASQSFPWHFSFKSDSRKRFGTWSVPRQTLPSSSNYKHRIIAMHFLHVSSMWLRPPPHKQSQSTHCIWSLALSPRWCRLKGVQGSRPSIPWNPGLGTCEVAPEEKCCEILLVAEVTLHHCVYVLMAFGDSQRRGGNVFFLFYDPFLFIPFLEKPQPLSPSSL